MLPTIIEYLASRPRGDGQLASLSTSQTIIENVPAGAQFTIAQLPGTDYAAIGYDSEFHPDMVPGAFWASMQYGGNLSISGNIEANWMLRPFSGYVVISRKRPAILSLRNRTNVAQFYGGLTYSLSVKTEEDYSEIVMELERYGTQALGHDVQETNRLLTAMLQSQGIPRLPV